MAVNRRYQIPQPGPRLEFRAWVRLIVDGVRRRCPPARRSEVERDGGHDAMRFNDRSATLTEDGSTRWVTFAGASIASIYDQERSDEFTAANIGKSVAGFFDPEHSRPDR